MNFFHHLRLYRWVYVQMCVYIYTQALDGTSPLHFMYKEHLSMATAFYTQLLTSLEEHYQLPVTSMDATQLHGNGGENPLIRDEDKKILMSSSVII